MTTLTAAHVLGWPGRLNADHTVTQQQHAVLCRQLLTCTWDGSSMRLVKPHILSDPTTQDTTIPAQSRRSSILAAECLTGRSMCVPCCCYEPKTHLAATAPFLLLKYSSASSYDSSPYCMHLQQHMGDRSL